MNHQLRIARDAKKCTTALRNAKKLTGRSTNKHWFDPKVDEQLRNSAKDLKAVDFEVIKEIGEGNFSKSKPLMLKNFNS